MAFAQLDPTGFGVADKFNLLQVLFLLSLPKTKGKGEIVHIETSKNELLGQIIPDCPGKSKSVFGRAVKIWQKFNESSIWRGDVGER